jgi:hypothetical protein
MELFKVTCINGSFKGARKITVSLCAESGKAAINRVRTMAVKGGNYMLRGAIVIGCKHNR